MTLAVNTQSHFNRWLFWLSILSFQLWLSGCEQTASPQQLSGATMGTTWNVSYRNVPGSPSPPEVQAAIERILVRVNDSMSTYLPQSEISRFNEAGINQWLAVSPEYLSVLQAALDVGAKSHGAYDVTVAPLVDRWGFGPQPRSDNLPTTGEIEQLLESVGQQHLRVDGQAGNVMKMVPVQIDFSSIAKGFAVDQVADWLSGEQFTDFLVEIGGEMRVAGVSARGDAWRIAIEQPRSGGREVAATLELRDIAVATSGDYRNYFESEGKRYSHSIDPRTGFPVIHDLVSVTVLHKSAMMADAWATALTVLGPSEAMDVAREQALAVYFIQRHGDEFSSAHSEQFEPYLVAVTRN